MIAPAAGHPESAGGAAKANLMWASDKDAYEQGQRDERGCRTMATGAADSALA